MLEDLLSQVYACCPFRFWTGCRWAAFSGHTVCWFQHFRDKLALETLQVASYGAHAWTSWLLTPRSGSDWVELGLREEAEVITPTSQASLQRPTHVSVRCRVPVWSMKSRPDECLPKDTANWPEGVGGHEAAAQNLVITVSPRLCVWGVARSPREGFIREKTH